MASGHEQHTVAGDAARFHGIAGTAGATGLADRSVDLAVAYDGAVRIEYDPRIRSGRLPPA